MRYLFPIIVFLLFGFGATAQGSFQIALLKYNGGGDWYANLETSIPNLIEFCNKNINTNIQKQQAIVEVGSEEIYNYPFVHMTGHGNIIFSEAEAQNLRNYLKFNKILLIELKKIPFLT